ASCGSGVRGSGSALSVVVAMDFSLIWSSRFVKTLICNTQAVTVRVGVVGVGVMGADHARKLARVVSGSELVAVTDFAAGVAAAVAGERGARTHEDGLALIGDPAVGAVVVATRDDTHADLVLAALRAGKPVMCEKPLAPTADECRAVATAQAALQNP